MDSIFVPRINSNGQKKRYKYNYYDYKLDLWMELRRRWLMLGVLVSILLAVVSPRVGAPGGPLRAEYLSYAPLSYIYYSSGRRMRAPASIYASTCACALTAAHAHVVAPALCALAAASAADAGLHDALVKGALLAGCGAPCGWLSLAAAADATTASLCVATSSLASLAAAPIALYFICGRAPIPPLGSSIWSALCILLPFVCGMLYTFLRKNTSNSVCIEPLCGCTNIHDCTETLCDCTEALNCSKKLCTCVRPCMLVAKMCALLLVYFDCCERLRDVEGSVHIFDVLGTIVFAVVYVSASALAWAVYARVGLASAPARSLAVCSVPKAMHTGWQVSGACVAGGLGRLPGALLAPAQALLVAALDRDG